MAEHALKTWPEYFEHLRCGLKTFELRKDDRGFQIGDTLLLREYDPHGQEYSGREVQRTIIHLLRHRPGAGCAAEFGLAPGYVILSLSE